MGYTERDDLPVGPVSLVTHSGSVFSTLLRTRLRLGFDLAVSSGQELVTTTADYVDHVVDHTDTRVLALVLETIRDGDRLRWSLRRAREAGIEVVLLPVGHSPLGSAMVAAHSGAVAGGSAAWEALADDVAGHLVDDLAELTDTLALLASPRRPRAGGALATVHDSGAERSLVADLAHGLGVPFATLAPETRAALAARLDDGLEPDNPLDVWGGGADTHHLFADCLPTMAADPAVGVDGPGRGPGPRVRRRHGLPRRRARRRRGHLRSRSSCWPACPPASTSAPPTGCGPPAYPCSRASAAGCWPCAPAGRRGPAAPRRDPRLAATGRRPAARGVRHRDPARPRRLRRGGGAARGRELGWPVVLKTAAARHHPPLRRRRRGDRPARRGGRPRGVRRPGRPPRPRRHRAPAGAGGRGAVGGHRARPRARSDGRGGGGRRAGRAARRPGGGAAAADPSRAPGGCSTGCGCGRCSTASAERRRSTSTRWPT